MLLILQMMLEVLLLQLLMLQVLLLYEHLAIHMWVVVRCCYRNLLWFRWQFAMCWCGRC